MLRVDGLTISRGGPCWPGFVLMREPYTGPYGEPTTGSSFVSRERARRAIEFCAREGLRLNIVSAGLAEHDDYLEDLRATDAVPPGWAAISRRWARAAVTRQPLAAPASQVFVP